MTVALGWKVERAVRYTKLQARRSKQQWHLPLDYCRGLLVSACSYCGRLPAIAGFLTLRDPALGYAVGNAVPACSDCNRAKGKRCEADFLAHVKLISDSNRETSS